MRTFAKATAAVAVLAASAPGRGAGPAPRARRPIMDTHIHLYQVTRPGGVPWPSPKQKTLYRDVLPPEYKALAREHGIQGTGIVEASPDFEDNFKVLELTRNDAKFFPFLVAQIDMGAPDFAARLERLARDKRVVGVRAFLWGPKLTLDAQQIANVKLLAAKGMTLDLVSRGDMNPKDKVAALASAAPDLRIILDHLAGAKGERPSPEWELSMRRLADEHPNVHIKFSSFYDMYNPDGREEAPWKSPTDLGHYKAGFDVLLSAFGEDRLIWGSNWPVCELGGDFGRQIELAEEYLAPHGTRVRDKVMHDNALKFYRRVVPKAK